MSGIATSLVAVYPDGNSYMSTAFKGVKDGDFFVFMGGHLREANERDFKRVNETMPAEMMLQAKLREGYHFFRARCLPNNHPVDNYRTNPQPVESRYTNLVDELAKTANIEFDDQQSLYCHYKNIREQLNILIDSLADKVNRKNARDEVEHEMLSCYGNCKVLQLRKSERDNICKTCRRNDQFVDRFDDGKGGAE